jgi:hypothetical protein
MNIEAGFVPARRDYAGPSTEPQKEEGNGQTTGRSQRLRANE